MYFVAQQINLIKKARSISGAVFMATAAMQDQRSALYLNFIKLGTRYDFKTHLTNHYLEIRCDETLLEVVKATGTKDTNPHHIFASYKCTTP